MPITRSLRFKWIATLLLTSLVGVVMVGVFAYLTTVQGYDRLRVQQAEAAFVETVTTYYQTHQSWDGLEEWLRTQTPPGGPGYAGAPSFCALADAGGLIVADAGPFRMGARVDISQIARGIPIVIDDETVGTVLPAPPPDLDPRERDYLRSTNRALLLGGLVAGLLAIVIGVLLSQSFLNPLTELTSAITAVRQGDLNQQVPVRTRDELGELARTFNQMSTEIHRVNELRTQMTADIAHDLRTPLLVITGYLEGLRDGTLKPTPDRLEAMNQEAVLLTRLVDDLRTLSLSDAGELKLMQQPVPPRELLEQVRQAFEPIADERQIALRVEADAGLPDLEIDRERMVQVLANLVHNALRHTPSGGSVTLLARMLGRDVELDVNDTGSGIPEDRIANIFERFYRVDESRSQSQGETGLGLAIAKSIVEAHHGSISARSRVGEGTSITIRLRPAGKAAAQ